MKRLVLSGILAVGILFGVSSLDSPKAEAYGYCPGSQYFCIGQLYFGTDICTVLFNWQGNILSVWNCRPSGFSIQRVR